MKRQSLWALILASLAPILVMGALLVYVSRGTVVESAEGRRSELVKPAGSVTRIQENFHVVAPGVWRSALPDKKSLERMRAYGLKTVVNLTTEASQDEREKKWARELGLRYEHFPLHSREKQNPETLRKILSVVSDPANQPVLIHCRAGKDRTGLVSALYKLEHTGESFEDIRLEMLLYGYDEDSFPHLIETVKNWRRPRS